MLNPIKSVSSAFKARLRSFTPREARSIQDGQADSTFVAHRNSILVRIAELYLPEAATEKMCSEFDAHTLRFYNKVFLNEGMPVGK